MWVRHLLLLGLSLACCAKPADAGTTSVDAECGVEFTLPDPTWQLHDQSRGGRIVHLYSPSSALVPRLGLILEAKALVPDGLGTRAAQISRLVGSELRPTEAEIGGRPAQRIEYVVKGVRAVEYGIDRDPSFLLVQIVAEEKAWDDPVAAEQFRAVLASVRLREAQQRALRLDPTTPEQVRAARSALERPRKFAVRSHDARVAIAPTERRLTCRDTFRVEAIAEAIDELALRCTGVSVDSIRQGGRNLVFRPAADGSLAVALAAPLRQGASVELEFYAHADDYFLAIDKSLVPEIEVLAQARPESTYSSHACYYPVDAENDASVRLELAVPAPYVAVSGGAEVAPPPSAGARAWSFEARPRLLPPGFAVAKYHAHSASTESGLVIAAYDLGGSDGAWKEHLAVAVRAARLFDEQMGPLPWRRVAFCEVRPERKDTAVSLPGLVLVSDRFLREAAGARLRGKGFAASENAAVMVFVDELAHQWNAYAAPYANELAEGLSTFACLLYLEREAGAGEYRDGVASCADVYLAAAATSEDVAPANPKLFHSDCYRVVAFAKVPAVLDLLRRTLGDTRFFAGWRAAFADAPRGRRLDYDDLRRAFEKASGEDLFAFFEQWFFRPGSPRVRLTWETAEANGHLVVRGRIVQTQPGRPFDVEVPIEIRTAKEVLAKSLHLLETETSFEWELPERPLSVRMDPERLVPLAVQQDR